MLIIEKYILDRVFPHRGLTYSDWNDPYENERQLLLKNTFALPIGPPRSQGFTVLWMHIVLVLLSY